MVSLFAFVSGIFPGFSGDVQQANADELRICGTVDVNTTWRAADSPIIITCSTTVNAGVTLTIEPGVQVRLVRGSAKGRVWFRVEGELIARGTEEQPILFTSAAINPLQGDWASLIFAKNSASSRFDADGKYSGGSILEFCVVEFGGSAGRLGAIEVGGVNLYLNHVVIQKNAASAIEVRDGGITVRNSTLVANSNSQGLGGAIIAHTATIALDSTTVKRNSVAGAGGGIYALASQVSLKNSDVVDNKADGKGGGIFLTDSTLSIEGSRFTGNISSYRGGALYTSRVKLTVEDTEFVENRAELTSVTIGEAYGDSRAVAFGGAAYFADSDVHIERTSFLQNFAGDQCGAFAASDSRLHIRENVFVENTAEVNGTALCLYGVKPGSSITRNAFAQNYPAKGNAANTIYFAEGPLPQFSGNSLFEPGKIIIYNEADTELNATGNWWGTRNEDVKDRILGLATFLPTLDQPGTLPEVKER